MAAPRVKSTGRDGEAGPAPSFSSLLAELVPDSSNLPDPKEEPGRAFRRAYDGWVKRGGFLRGKPRHSVRKIKLWLGSEHEVRSLETKLAGKTLLQRPDAANLLRLFLELWTYDSQQDRHQAYPDVDVEVLVGRLTDELYPTGRSTLLLPIRSRSGKQATVAAGAKASPNLSPSRDVLKDLFFDSSALITISSAQTLIGQDQASMMQGFRNLMRGFHDIDAEDDIDRALIWIVDLGLRYGTEHSIAAYLNVVWLATQFRSLMVIDSKNGVDLWQWLEKRAVFVVGSLEQREIDRCYADADLSIKPADSSPRWFRGSDLGIEGEPTEWMRKDKLLQAFGEPLEVWRRRTITAHLALDEWQEGELAQIDPDRDLRYFFHGAVAGDSTARCLELGQPGQRWSDAFRLACTAAFWRLGWDRQVGQIEDPKRAMALLRHHGFAALTLWDFVRLTNNLIRANLPKEPS